MTSGMRSNNWRPSSTPTPPKPSRQIHHCRAKIAHTRADLQRWHIHRQQRITKEQERYAQHELPYKAICHLNDAMTDTGHRTITTVRQEDGSLTNNPPTVLQVTRDSFLRQHTPNQDTLNADTQAKIDRLPQVFNHAQRRQLENRHFTIHEVRKAIHSLQQHKTAGYDGRPAETYYHLPAHLLRILAHRLWDIVTGQAPLPPDWANVVRPLYKKGDWANPDNWRPIVCAVTEVKIVWTILLRRIRPHLDHHIPVSLWGAIPGRSPHEDIFLQDTIANMDQVDLIIASLDVKGAFPNTPWLLLEGLWKRLGLPFYNFASGYIRTRKYTVRTGAGLTPFLEPGSGVPQGGAEGPFLYLLVTLLLALAIKHNYPAYAPYPLLSPLVGFADDTNLTVANTPHEPHALDPGPAVTQQANDLLDVTISYLSRNNLIIHPTKSVAMIKGSATPPTLGPQGPAIQVVTTTTHLGVIQAANPEDATLPPKLQSHLAHLPRYVFPTTKALSLSHQSLVYYLTGVLDASIGFQALHLTHPTTALQPATRAVTKAWAAHGGWPTSIPSRAIGAAWPHYGDAIGDEVKAAYNRHTALLLHRMTHNVRVAGCPVRVSLTLARWYAIQRGLSFRELGPVVLLVVPACPLRVCALALPRRPLPPRWVVWIAHLARSRHWALVGPFHVVRAPPRVLPRSLALSGVLGGGRSGSGSPPAGLGLCAPRGGGGRASPGGCLRLLRGASDVRRSPSPDCPPTGRAVGVHYPRAVGPSVWVWGPNAVPLACMPCGGCVPRGWRGAVPGGRCLRPL